MGLTFNLKPQPTWIAGSDDSFTKTEIGKYTKAERDKIAFHIAPLLRADSIKIVEDNTTIKNPVPIGGQSEPDTRQPIEITDKLGTATDAEAMVVIGWKGLLGEDFEDLPFTEENLKDLCNVYPLLAAAFIEVAGGVANRVETNEAEVEKNSLNSSNGESD